jgi:hypothetical protein
MIRQDFELILREKIKAPDELLLIAKKFIKKPIRSDGLLESKDDFVDFLRAVNKLPDNFLDFKQQFMERAICFRNDVEKPIVMSPFVVREMIKAWNPKWNLNNLIYNFNKMSLQLRGVELLKLNNLDPWSSRLCFLRFLKITHLDIKHTSIASLSHLQGMELENVDIRHTRIKDLHPHEATRDINTAIISPGQFSKKALSHLPPAVKIIEKD